MAQRRILDLVKQYEQLEEQAKKTSTIQKRSVSCSIKVKKPKVVPEISLWCEKQPSTKNHYKSKKENVNPISQITCPEEKSPIEDYEFFSARSSWCDELSDFSQDEEYLSATDTEFASDNKLVADVNLNLKKHQKKDYNNCNKTTSSNKEEFNKAKSRNHHSSESSVAIDIVKNRLNHPSFGIVVAKKLEKITIKNTSNEIPCKNKPKDVLIDIDKKAINNPLSLKEISMKRIDTAFNCIMNCSEEELQNADIEFQRIFQNAHHKNTEKQICNAIAIYNQITSTMKN